jgi:hypothetical protein
MTQEEIIKQTERKPHLFILGAGATKACIPNGDKNQRTSPVMEGFLASIGKEDILNDVNLETKSENIETIYSELHEKPEYFSKVKEIENAIVEYFSNMQIPDNPTLYDYLILSLRSKDCIATFNWDPLLVQAYKRVYSITTDLPQLVFLHGNVAIGLCKTCYTYSPLFFPYCPECHSTLEPIPLLYPAKKKDYTQHWGIEGFWRTFEHYLEAAAIVTIWGYSAPESDKTAIKMMLKVFSSSFRKLDQIEIIDIADPNVIADKWENFSKETNYHFKVVKSLSSTLLWEFPRRSIEGYIKRIIGGSWEKSKLTLKENLAWDELENLVEPLLEQEYDNQISVI